MKFASAGPKNYGYVAPVNTRGRQQLNFDILKKNVIDEVTTSLKESRQIKVFNPHKITRDVQTKQLVTQTEIKRYQVVFDKHVVNPNTFLSYPCGYHV